MTLPQLQVAVTSSYCGWISAFIAFSSVGRAATRPFAEYRTETGRALYQTVTCTQAADAPWRRAGMLASPPLFPEFAVSDTILRLALPSPLRRLFDYLAPEGVPHTLLQPGVRLRVPFGRREVVGVLVEVASHSEVPADRLRPALQL